MPGRGAGIYQGALNASGTVATDQGAFNPITGTAGPALQLLPGGSSGAAIGINDAGQMAGVSVSAAGGRAVRWESDGTATDLGVLAGGSRSVANGINSAGQAAGSSWAAGNDRAVRWESDGAATDLGVLAGGSFSAAYGINSVGQVAGISNSGASSRAVRWESNGAATDLGVLAGGDQSAAFAINAAGQVAGYGTNSVGWFRAVRWAADGTATDLGVLTGFGDDSFAWGINAAGTVVGTSARYMSYSSRAFIWRDGSGLQSLADYVGLATSWDFTEARSINDRGDVLAYGYALDGSYEGWLVVHNTAAAVPEPAPLALLLLGLSGLAFRHRRSKLAEDRRRT